MVNVNSKFAPASNEVQGSPPAVPLRSAAIRIATNYLILVLDFSIVAFVSTRPYVSLLRGINQKEIRIEKRRYLAKPTRVLG